MLCNMLVWIASLFASICWPGETTHAELIQCKWLQGMQRRKRLQGTSLQVEKALGRNSGSVYMRRTTTLVLELHILRLQSRTWKTLSKLCRPGTLAAFYRIQYHVQGAVHAGKLLRSRSAPEATHSTTDGILPAHERARTCTRLQKTRPEDKTREY